jgi:N-acetylglutamate synthase-like GNAT family acetyltransferase
MLIYAHECYGWEGDLVVECLIRPAQREDAEGVSRLIISVEQSFSPAAVSDLLKHRLVFVALNNDTIVGTASLDGQVVRTVFVDPRCQGRGIGRALMAEVERVAVERDIAVLAVPSSVTAEPFYAKLGFNAVRDSFYGEERTIVMERPLVRFSEKL